jgi:TRAP-type C4-dicarboxylate transport system permease large subunit
VIVVLLRVFRTPIGVVCRVVWPVVIINFVALLVITYLPTISTALLHGR